MDTELGEVTYLWGRSVQLFIFRVFFVLCWRRVERELFPGPHPLLCEWCCRGDCRSVRGTKHHSALDRPTPSPSSPPFPCELFITELRDHRLLAPVAVQLAPSGCHLRDLFPLSICPRPPPFFLPFSLVPPVFPERTG